MINFFRFLFGGSIPSTHKYEAKLNSIEDAHQRFIELNSSPAYLRYLELKELVASPAFIRKLSEIKRLSYKKSPEAAAEHRYLKLKKSKDVKKYLATNEQGSSPLVVEFIKLSEQMSTDVFISRKNYLLDKNRYQTSEEYSMQEEYNQLVRSESVTLRDKLKKKYAKIFAIQELWECTFEDNFDKLPIDGRWSNKLFWSEALIKQPYSQENELQLTTEGNNLELQNGMLSIVTRKEQANGLAWDAKLGFIPKSFGYTSGVVNTSLGFRQQRGRFVAKVKMTQAAGIYHAFWLAGDKNQPHINICKQLNKQLQVGAYSENRIFEKQISRLNEDFYIFELLWDEWGFTWYINGKQVYRISLNVDIPLYLAFSSGIIGEVKDHQLPQYLQIEWVKCYRKK